MNCKSLFTRYYLVLLYTTLILIVYLRTFDCARSVIYSDAEGYYIYLPAVFNLHDIHAVQPGSMGPIKNEKGESVTKYTCGVAYCQLPFFLVAKAYCDRHGIPEDDIFNNYYAGAVIAAGLTAGFIGLFFLQRALRRRGVREPVVFLTLLAIYGGTNLFHYATRESGMSHVYSFMLFAMLVWQIPRALSNLSWKNAALLGLVTGWILLIRPTNGLLAMLFILLYDVYSWEDLEARFRLFKAHIPKLIVAAVAGLAICFPQMLYWHEMMGKWVMWSYQGESFAYWYKPKLAAVLFDPQNGLFLYSPVVLLPAIGIYLDWKEKQNQAVAAAVVFILATYLFASWWAWWFGGAFGHRCYVDLYPMLAFLFAGMIARILAIQRPVLRRAGILLFAFLIFYGIRMSFLYTHLAGPWDGADWRWNLDKMYGIWKHLFDFD